jgi:hypothetical protein
MLGWRQLLAAADAKTLIPRKWPFFSFLLQQLLNTEF